VARAFAHVADNRQDYLHKLTTRLVRENQTIVVEGLHVRAMVRNHNLARAIHDAAWYELRRQLAYKAGWYGRDLIVLDRWYPSSKRCSRCGYVADIMPLHVRLWTCPGCSAQHDRDVNAARNILAAGLAAAACGEDVRPRRPRVAAAIPDEAGIKANRGGSSLQVDPKTAAETPVGRTDQRFLPTRVDI
jgi:putative transposase